MVGHLLLVFSTVLAIIFGVVTTLPSPPAPETTAPALPLTVGKGVGKLVIDTDAGADDAMALLVALGQEKREKIPEVVAITCVRGNTELDNVVVNVLKTLKTAGRLDIPVYRGANSSLLTSPPSDNFFGNDGFGDFEYPSPPNPKCLLKKGHAVNALIDIVSKNPGEITLLCLGPLTNIALAIRLDPLFLTKVRQIVVLGGSVEGVGNVLPGVEFNFYIDPEAAFVVFNSTDVNNSNIKPVILIPWESVSRRNMIPMDWRVNVLGKLKSKQMELLNQAERSVLKFPDWISADTLASAVVVQPSIVTSVKTEHLHVSPLLSQNTRGAVFVDYQDSLKQSKNVIIVENVDVERYKTLLMQNLA